MQAFVNWVRDDPILKPAHLMARGKRGRPRNPGKGDLQLLMHKR